MLLLLQLCLLLVPLFLLGNLSISVRTQALGKDERFCPSVFCSLSIICSFLLISVLPTRSEKVRSSPKQHCSTPATMPRAAPLPGVCPGPHILGGKGGGIGSRLASISKQSHAMGQGLIRTTH